MKTLLMVYASQTGHTLQLVEAAAEGAAALVLAAAQALGVALSPGAC